jgi:adenylate cyclase
MTNGSEMQDNPQVTRILELSRDDPGRLRELEQFRRPITVLFADIAGSTAYFEKFGDIPGLAMVHKFNHLVRNAVEEFAGRVIKNIGDGIMATFEDTGQSVQASIETQRRLKQVNASNELEHRFAVRIGLHHGIGIVRSDSDVFGDVVNVASRIQSLAQPGPILVSDTVREKIADGSFQFRALGFFQLKGKSEERDLFEVLWEPEIPANGTAGMGEHRLAFGLCRLGANRVAGAEQLPISDGQTIGQHNADLSFPDTAMDSPHARLLIVDGQPVIEDLSAKAGVFVQSIGAQILEHDDTIMMGSRFFQFFRKAETAALVQVDREGSQSGEPYPLGEKEVRFGRITGDFIFPDDGLMSRTHARLFRRGNDYLVEDLASRNGTFVKVRGRARIPLQARVWLGGAYFCFVQAPE